VVAIVLVLCSVFVPIAFLGGLTGELFRQFAITISISVSLSGLVALTMTPALCVLVLKHEDKKTNFFFNGFNRFFNKVTGHYVTGVSFFLRRGLLALMLVIGMVVITANMWLKTPSSLVPDEDQGFYISAVFLPDGASLQ
ncbi:MAG TPA: hydrophobe/amphiphile efflux-1 family RND transporter, partial [Colwellia sp.]|nr:hydrophobe/amphiphile efflux-1 family RND transporter [Colwellia sp.]